MDKNPLLSPHFKALEFLPPGSEWEHAPEGIKRNLKALAQALEPIRERIGKPLVITKNGGGWRPHGSKGSAHTYGLAVDINVHGMKPSQVQSLVRDWGGGLGIYDGHTHLDLWGLAPYTAFPSGHPQAGKAIPARRRWFGKSR